MVEERDEDKSEDDVLKGTTLKAYKFVFKSSKAVRPYEVQRGLGFSSPSVAQYHLAKLLSAGLVQESEAGYTVNKVIFGSLLRIRRTVLHFQITYSILFASALVVLLTIFRPPQLSSVYVFSLVVIWIALGTSLFECLRALRGL